MIRARVNRKYQEENDEDEDEKLLPQMSFGLTKRTGNRFEFATAAQLKILGEEYEAALEEQRRHKAGLSPNRKRVGLEPIKGYYGLFHDLKRVVERGEEAKNAAAAHLTQMEKMKLLPVRVGLVHAIGKNKHVDASFHKLTN